jgi:hypothetical protein
MLLLLRNGVLLAPLIQRLPWWMCTQVTEVPPFSADANEVLDMLATTFSAEQAQQVHGRSGGCWCKHQNCIWSGV